MSYAYTTLLAISLALNLTTFAIFWTMSKDWKGLWK